MSQTDGTNTLYYAYDVAGRMLGVQYNGTNYYYMRNLQGDVIGIYDSNGDIVARYLYDTWGAVVSATDANGMEIADPDHIANVNPIRYRGYYYDTETGFYYLQSRYYNPEWCRFLNADVLFLAGNALTGSNMFAYCLNNPVMFSDPSGLVPITATLARQILRMSSGLESNPYGFTAADARAVLRYSSRLDNSLSSELVRKIAAYASIASNEVHGYGYSIIDGLKGMGQNIYLLYHKNVDKVFTYTPLQLPDVLITFMSNIDAWKAYEPSIAMSFLRSVMWDLSKDSINSSPIMGPYFSNFFDAINQVGSKISSYASKSYFGAMREVINSWSKILNW